MVKAKSIVKKGAKKPSRRSPVAKFAGKVNKPAVHKDKKKAQKRGETKIPIEDELN